MEFLEPTKRFFGVFPHACLHDDTSSLCLRISYSIPQCNYDVLFAYLTSHNYDFAYVHSESKSKNWNLYESFPCLTFIVLFTATTSPIPFARVATFARQCSTVRYK